MLHKLLAGHRSHIRSILSVMLCLALICGTVASMSVFAAEPETETELETETVTEAVDTSEQVTETVTEAQTSTEEQTVEAIEDVSEEVTEEVTDEETESLTVLTAQVNETVTNTEVDADSDTGSSNDGISLTADGPGDNNRPGDGGSTTKTYNHLDVEVYGGTISGTVTSSSSEVTNVTVTKTWDDDDDAEGIRPSSISVSLVDGEGNVKGTATLSAENNWTYTWEELSLDEGTYTVTEDSVTGYTSSGGSLEVTTSSSSGGSSSTYSGTITITGIGTTAYVYSSNGTLKYTVTFSGEPTTSGSQYEYQTSHNLSLALEDGDIIQLTVSYSYSYTLNGQTYTGTISDATVKVTVDLDSNECPDGAGYDFVISATELFESTVKIENDVSTTITNTLDTVDIPVSKIWDDNEDASELRPDEVTVTLYKNGTATDQTLTLSESNNWAGTFEDLSEYGLVDGSVQKNTYTVQEGEVSNYTATITANEETGGYTITNTLNTMDITVTKIVTGNMGDQTRKFTITVNGNELSLSHNESETISGLTIGSTVTLTETGLEGTGYETPVVEYNGQTITADSDGSYSITLVSGATEITVTNTKDVKPDTGINLDSAPYIAILFGVALFGTATLIRRRRRLL